MSTGIVSFFPEKSKTTSAVFGPTPESCKSSALASARGIDKILTRLLLYLSSISLEACFIALVLLW